MTAADVRDRLGRGLALPAKLIAFLLAADALVAWGGHAFPPSPDNPLWRHMTVGTLGQSLGLVVLALLVALAAGLLQDNRRSIAAMGRIGLGLAALILLLLVPFLLDSRTLVASLPQEQRPRFGWLVAKGVGQYLLAVLALGAMGVAARRFLAAHPEAEAAADP